MNKEGEPLRQNKQLYKNRKATYNAYTDDWQTFVPIIFTKQRTQSRKQACKVVMEDLNVKGMMKNRHLSKAIQQQKFKELSRQMEYKCEKYGIEYMKVNRLSILQEVFFMR